MKKSIQLTHDRFPHTTEMDAALPFDAKYEAASIPMNDDPTMTTFFSETITHCDILKNMERDNFDAALHYNYFNDF